MNWSEPRCKIEGCDEQGYVSIAEKLVDLNIPGEKEPLPIWAIFNSSSQTASPYVGMGWRIPFLECNMVQLSENEFMLLQPSGWKRLFRRSAKGSDVLDGGGGWKGQLSPDHATLWADCGWRIDLHKGKIVQIKTSLGQTLSYNYTNGRISSVVCGTKTLIGVDSADGPDHTLGIAIDGTRYFIVKTDQPQVQSVAKVNVVAGNTPSFSQLTGPERQTRSFVYNVDAQTRPELTITTPAKLDIIVSWDPETRRITRAGDWKYDIKPGDSPSANAAISRINAAGQKEFWSLNATKGEEIVQGINGIKEVTSRFTSGKAAGATRKIEQIANGKAKVVYQASYDEKGKLFREISGNGEVTQFAYDNQGELKTSIRHGKDGIKKEIKEFNKGRLSAIKSSDGYFAEYLYDEKGRESKLILNKGKLVRETQYSADTRKSVRFKTDSGTTEYSFDHLGILKEILTR